jgi:hypothetical protein
MVVMKVALLVMSLVVAIDETNLATLRYGQSSRGLKRKGLADRRNEGYDMFKMICISDSIANESLLYENACSSCKERGKKKQEAR